MLQSRYTHVANIVRNFFVLKVVDTHIMTMINNLIRIFELVTESEKKGGGAASDKKSTSQQDAGGGGSKDSDATFVAGAATPAAATVSIGKQVIEALERGNRALVQHLEVQKSNWDADREQRTALLAALNRLGDAVARIADKL
jgi:hypothetical protein